MIKERLTFTCAGDGMIDYNEFVTMMVAKVSPFRFFFFRIVTSS